MTNARDLPVEWFTSSYSNDQGGECVRGAHCPNGSMAVSDSKDPCGPALLFPAPSWIAFVDEVNSGRLDV
ncbi:DUF397 domain-containing protein [Streptomyces lunaelactis]|uniref:DUF397 domain-containing protein n=1 Tax=Streptomyces lunaelactis TaxID=1535768 RepID=A0A2R4SVQ0_9ACTN|nr:DUF397 domain-containing protein [Streptomyces lunaelactis]AVZ70957.1 DUF397 domain-containing protein [Streptomyces lunaelactis]NUK28056.1 DUF397 domain-containing protein [Streptomyces lunaelactis]NUK89725.1 DUF397 domain-containing protein [Streptomyces lunaelactis]